MNGLMFQFFQLGYETPTLAPVPLKGVAIKADVEEFLSSVTVEQKYINVEDQPIEVTYIFPVEEEAAVVSFEAAIEGKTIVAEIKGKEEARKEYHEAVNERKDTAILLEEKSKDLFEIKLGQLKPGSGAKITIKYVGELPVVEDGKIALTIPTTVAPRYTPSNDNSEAAKAIKSMKHVGESPAKVSFEINGRFREPPTQVHCPSHQDVVFESKGSGQWRAETSSKDMDRDLVVHFQRDNLEKPHLVLEKDETLGWVAMLSMVPSFKLTEQPIEAVFLMDRSGSMGGESIARAKEAMILFLASLPSNCYFNIWSFGSRFSALFRHSQPYNDGNLAKAKAHVRGMDANMGGTEIYRPLEALFNQPAMKERAKQVFVLTDGEVSNVDSVMSLVKQNNAKSRCFALGIGAAASRHLVKGLARSGNGTALFAGDNGEDLRPKVHGSPEERFAAGLRRHQVGLEPEPGEGQPNQDVFGLRQTRRNPRCHDDSWSSPRNSAQHFRWLQAAGLLFPRPEHGLKVRDPHGHQSGRNLEDRDSHLRVQLPAVR